MLTAVVFLPLVGALSIALFFRTPRLVRLFASCISLATFIISIVVFVTYDVESGGFQLVQQYIGWIPFFDIQYHLAIDGLSAPLVLLTGLLGLAAVFSSWSVSSRHKEYFTWLLIMQTAVMGVFTAQDFVLFFVFWELELLPMYFLISIWGSGRKEYSAMKFVIFTLAGSAFMLLGILALGLSSGSFDMTKLVGLDQSLLVIPGQVIFALFFIAFAVKLPIWPLHTWLPDAHTDAPTAVSVMLAGVLLKMGGYGLIRINLGILPDVAHGASLIMAVLAIVGIIYGAMVTIRQTDLKRLVAYSSVSHMGYVLLGIASIGSSMGPHTDVGVTGASLQMFAHGTITGLMFVSVGLIYDRTHTRHIPDLGGLSGKIPLIAMALFIAGLGSLGLPSTSGFVGELMIFLGTFQVWPIFTILAVFGILIAAGYILWTFQRTLFGPSIPRWQTLTDASPVEMVAPVVLSISILIVGLYPSVLVDVFGVGIGEILGSVTR